MGTLLDFASAARPASRSRRGISIIIKSKHLQGAEIIPFPGVRREYMSEPAECDANPFDTIQ
ncbi:hypothetical protein [Roseibium sp. RKSG952]|uniref:hypothetical protein n=1 Tax=Roseibium sp. RKSG952 TaxID=2529384 RepID=UPI0012BD5730|nr:hypothetical protein [Roseibium sp. RKSG952]MTH97562.1 hypothetical protein [Roseibium sp. RKSG952]